MHIAPGEEHLALSFIRKRGLEQHCGEGHGSDPDQGTVQGIQNQADLSIAGWMGR
jgi:hypothetical protein